MDDNKYMLIGFIVVVLSIVGILYYHYNQEPELTKDIFVVGGCGIQQLTESVLKANDIDITTVRSVNTEVTEINTVYKCTVYYRGTQQ